MDELLQLRGVSAAYEGLRALEGITLSVAAGEAVAVLGANGAGKSTLLKTISGQLPAAAGEMVFDGTRLNGLAPHQVARLGILSVPEGRKVFPGLTVEENLLTAVAARGISDLGFRIADLAGRLEIRNPQSAIAAITAVISERFTAGCRGWPSGGHSSAGCSAAASSRCWPSPGR